MSRAQRAVASRSFRGRGLSRARAQRPAGGALSRGEEIGSILGSMGGWGAKRWVGLFLTSWDGSSLAPLVFF